MGPTGFTGNMVLKMGEGQAQFVYRQLSAIEDKSETFRNGVEEIMSRFDFKKFGGAPVLGVRGIVIKCHGRSRADAPTEAGLSETERARLRQILDEQG